jgi:valyl-tRNA synthetase
MTTMELSKNFEHQQLDSKWYQHWLDKKYFNSTPDDRESYTVVIPPPNVTGVLHMGHCLNNTIQDILVRRARMQGKNACWVPGTDHASIATEAKVVQMLRERGISKSSLGRDEFLGYAWEWKEKYGGIILEQLKKLGCSLDWDRVNFTMDEDYSQSVLKVFVDLYNKGLIYRGKRMINWDPSAKTALSDEEVIMKETQSKLYYLAYELTDDRGQLTGDRITIATVRPETILGDTAIAINPNDERFKHLHGQYALVPLINRRIPIITDEYVEMEFGTGALKVTPAHDKNDDMLGQKHNLEVIDIMNDDGTFNEAAQLFVGEDRFEVRKKIIPELEAGGYLVKIEDYTNQVGYSERSNAVVEPRLSMQWWVKMKPLAEPALKVVMDDDIKFHPAKFKNLYQHWMTNIKDWCISRQLWWGHRIPAWYDANGNFYVAANEEEAKLQAAKKMIEDRYKAHDAYTHEQHDKTELNNISDNEAIKQLAATIQLEQDHDCLDTWFSSWLWPFEVFDGLKKPGNPEVQYYYPTATLVTAPEIIFFWVARMIMAGLEYEKQIPFKDVYFTGIVRDKQGRKMSKSLGNSPDLLDLIDKYGADAVRFGILISSPAGNDILFDESSLSQGSFFVNKMWNALKLVKMWEGRQAAAANDVSPVQNNFAITWMENRLSQASAEIATQMDQFRLSESLKTLYSLIWDDFCGWYLEWVKPGFEQPIDAAVYEKTVGFFTELMQLLHPFMPFVTEEIYHRLADRTDDICAKTFATKKPAEAAVLSKGIVLQQVITALREARAKNQLKPKDPVQLYVQSNSLELYAGIEDILCKQVNASEFTAVAEPIAGSIVVAVEKDKFYLKSSQVLDTTGLKETLLKDLAHQQGFLETVMKKLGNERFVQNAKPEVVAIEQKKKMDAEARIKVIEESLAAL